MYYTHLYGEIRKLIILFYRVFGDMNSHWKYLFVEQIQSFVQNSNNTQADYMIIMGDFNIRCVRWQSDHGDIQYSLVYVMGASNTNIYLTRVLQLILIWLKKWTCKRRSWSRSRFRFSIFKYKNARRTWSDEKENFADWNVQYVNVPRHKWYMTMEEVHWTCDSYNKK